MGTRNGGAGGTGRHYLARPRATPDLSIFLGSGAPGQRFGARTQQGDARTRERRRDDRRLWLRDHGYPRRGREALDRATDACDRLLRMLRFLHGADSYHGVLPHFLNGETGRTIPFSRKDAAPTCETSFLLAGLLCARQYFDRDQPVERDCEPASINSGRRPSGTGTRAAARRCCTGTGAQTMAGRMNHQIRGWNECLITYVLAASAPRIPSTPRSITGASRSADLQNGREFYGIGLPLGPAYGGPLFFTHYSFLGLDPRGLRPLSPTTGGRTWRTAYQLRALCPQSAWLQGLWRGLLGAYRERQL